MGARDRLRHAWNAFINMDNTDRVRSYDGGVSYGTRPDRLRLRVSNEQSIISSIYTRLSIDVAAAAIKHVRLDKDGRYLEDVDSGLNNCLTLEANLDQAATAFRQDIALTLFDKGVAALVPVDTTINPSLSGAFDVQTMRVGEISDWMPDKVRVSLYNEKTGRREDIPVFKRTTAIVENPLYSVMNAPNSTLQRIIRKLNLLDTVDEQSSSGKLDLLIQLPYVIKSDAKKQQAEQRRRDIEVQLKGSQYGIAYVDGTEKVTQLNRPAENNLLAQVTYLMDLLYIQLGLTPEVMNGTADEKAMRNYQNRTISPILTAITESMKRTLLTKTARTQGQTIMYFWDAFKLVPMEQIAEIADKLTRNEIVSSNEMRQVIGLKPSTDPKADELRNSNMPQSELGAPPPGGTTEKPTVVPFQKTAPGR
jgi:hypothetical protein